jgi:RHS repeat-associated protein
VGVADQQWLEVDFGTNKTINEIDVFTLQDNWAGPSEPTESMTFTQWGLTGYDVQYWDGSNWITVPGGSVTGNNKIWKKFTFSPLSTSKIRVLTNASVDGYSRLTEIEAYGPAETGGSGGVHWLVADHLGTPRMILDQTGNLANMKRHDYLPFGEELFAAQGLRTASLGYSGGDGVRQQFTGYERDWESGLDFAQARYYANSQGRFTGGDPLMASATAGDPQSWNRYSYTQNKPLVFVDPSGMMTNQNFYVDNSDFMVDVSAPTYINGTAFVLSASAADAGLSAGLVSVAHETAHDLSLQSQDPIQDVVTPNACYEFANRVRHIANNTNVYLAGPNGSDMVQSFMDKLAIEFTEFTSASDLGVAWSFVSENPDFRHGRHRDVGFKDEFQDHIGPDATPDQVRHAVGGLIAGFLWGDNKVSRKVMDSREDMKLPTGRADTRLNRVTMPMGAQLRGPFGGSRAAGLENWIRSTLCAPLRP